MQFVVSICERLIYMSDNMREFHFSTKDKRGRNHLLKVTLSKQVSKMIMFKN